MSEFIGRERIRELDLIRVISTLGIFTFHFFVDRSPFFCAIGQHGAYTGGVFVSVFLILSGFCLMLTHFELTPKYWWKRFTTIYPPFWIAFMFFYMKRAFYVGSFFWDYSLSPLSIVWSLLGIDGTVAIHGIRNYNLIGEWFLGVIILLYIIYPLCLKIIKKSKAFFAFVIYSLFILMFIVYRYRDSFFMVGADYNIITCMCCFGTGMLLCQLYKKEGRQVLYGIIGTLIIFIGYYCSLGTLANVLIGLGIFLILFNMTRTLVNITVVYKILLFFSKISFCFFLIHHQIILENTAIFEKNQFIAYFFTIVITIIYAWCLNQIATSLINVMNVWACKIKPIK